MKKDIVYFIDSVMKDRDSKRIIIQGWRLDRRDSTIPEIAIKESSVIKSMEIKDEFRYDVNTKYGLAQDTKCGFLVSIEVSIMRGVVRLVLSSQGDTRRVSFSLKKKYVLTNVFGSRLSMAYLRGKRGLAYLRRNGIEATIQRMKHEKKNSVGSYQRWIETQEMKISKEEAKGMMENWKIKPLISIVMPVYNVDDQWLSKCIESVQSQLYPNWELCIADDCSTKSGVKKLLQKYFEKDSRIKVVFREENGHICEATNSALSIAEGEYIGLLDNDDELANDALFEVVKLLQSNPDLDLIYSDEDKIDKFGKRMDPTFKPDWSPDLLMGTNYICHFGVYRRSIIEKIGGFRKGLEGAQDYDLVLRFTEKTDKIGHVSKVLYHWRMLETSTAVNQGSKGYAFEAGRKALEDSLKRRGIKGVVQHAAGLGLYDVNYTLLGDAFISIIIPTRDGFEDLKRCVDSIFLKTSYPNFEIIIADNGSCDAKVLALFEHYRLNHDNVRVEHIDIPFNYSTINNRVAKTAKGDYLLFLNNDTEIITSNWIEKMLSFAQFDRIGAVGAKLLYPDHTIQHAGVILGLGGAAGHGHHTFPSGDFGYFGRLAINVNYSAVTAACMMLKKKDFDTIGGFNEKLSVAFNDVDLCLRLMSLEKNNIWLHGVELYHFESKSRGYEDSPEKQLRFAEETAYMYEHWGDLIERDPFYNQNLTRARGDFSINMEKDIENKRKKALEY